MRFLAMAAVFASAAALVATSTEAAKVGGRAPPAPGPKPGPGPNPAPAQGSACSMLVQSLDMSKLLLMNDTSTSSAYSSAQFGGFNPLNNKLQPACIVQPTSADDVSKTMKAVFTTNTKYAVRAGGHTGMAGWDSVQQGVLIDFSKMTSFSYDKASSTISIQPGLRWGDVIDQSEPFGVAPMTGRVRHVGTGLLLGGGLSLLSPQEGYACDGIVSAEIVTPDGTIKTVNQQNDPALLRAIKGGGGRFGVVTKYQLQVFPTGTKDEKRWWGGSLTYVLPDSVDTLVKATERFVAVKDDVKAYILTNVGMIKMPAPTYFGIAYVFYEGTVTEFNQAFKDFLAIPGVIPALGPLSYYDMAAVTPLGWTDQQAYKWMGGSLYPKDKDPSSSQLPTSYANVWTDVKTFIQANEDTLASSFFSITPVKSTQIRKGYEKGGNALSPPNNDKSYMHWLLSAILDQGTTSFPAKLDQDRLNFLKSHPSDKELPLFLNEVEASQDTFRSYGWYNELKKTYDRFDPSGFSLKFQDGPKF